MVSVQSKRVACRQRRRVNKGNTLSDEREREKEKAVTLKQRQRGKSMEHVDSRTTDLLLVVVSNNNRENDGDDCENNECKDEANPSFFPCGASRDDGLICVTNPG